MQAPNGVRPRLFSANRENLGLVSACQGSTAFNDDIQYGRRYRTWRRNLGFCGCAIVAFRSLLPREQAGSACSGVEGQSGTSKAERMPSAWIVLGPADHGLSLFAKNMFSYKSRWSSSLTSKQWRRPRA